MFYQFFLSLQVKPSAIISNKHGKYKLRYDLPNDLRLSVDKEIAIVIILM